MGNDKKKVPKTEKEHVTDSNNEELAKKNR